MLGFGEQQLVDLLRRLGRVDQLTDLGRSGPLVASVGDGSLFECLFGRDAIRMATDLLGDFPDVARTTLIELARLQGVAVNPRADEEPGRILHEFRHADDRLLSTFLGRWDFPYYGAVDTTPQWINLLGEYCQRTDGELLDIVVIDRQEVARTLRDCLRAAVSWIVDRLKAPGGGSYLWVRRARPEGIANQVWEDSFDAYYHEDGTLFDPSRPYAPVAIQGYTYDALLTSAELLEDTASGIAPNWLRARARQLRTSVLHEFWQADLGTFAMAMTIEPDGTRRPARVVASSAGHLLASGLLDGADVADIRERLIARLSEPDLLAAAGIRTKATGSARFRPGSYHNGSVWPMDTGVVADGLRRHGHEAAAVDLEGRLLAGCAATGGFPEFFRGETDDSLRINTTIVDTLENGVANRLEQPPQMAQGWTATRVWRILRAQGALAADGTAGHTPGYRR